MNKHAAEATPEQQLTTLRARIDALDEVITRLLLERCGIVREVGALKHQHWPSGCHIRPGREGQMHRAITERFTGTDLPPAAALHIWRQLIGASTQLESPLAVTTLAHLPHHAWLAREYFGIGVGLHHEAALAEMLDAIGSGAANILLLPAPGTPDGDWWRDAAIFQTHRLSIFASLPVTTAPLPGNAAAALALAAVTPEPSGDDISYVALTTNAPTDAARLQAILPTRVATANPLHHLLMLDGFVTETSPELTSIKRTLGDAVLSLTILGAHPRPVTIQE